MLYNYINALVTIIICVNGTRSLYETCRKVVYICMYICVKVFKLLFSYLKSTIYVLK